MSEGRPDLATVADALSGALDPARQAELDALLATEPGARATFARHERTLTATMLLLAAEPAPTMPAAVADSLDAAIRSAAADRRPVTAGSVAAPADRADRADRSVRPLRRYLTNLALAAAVVAVLAVTVTRLDGSGSGSSASSAGGTAVPASTAATTPAAAAAAPAVPSAPAAAPAVPSAPDQPPATRDGLSAGTGAPLSAGAALRGGAVPPLTSTAALTVAQLPAVARSLATDPAARTASCPSRPGTRTLLRPVVYAGAAAWLTVTATDGGLLTEVTRTVCGPALLTRTVSPH